MAHKKGEGSTQNGRDSNPKYLGVKLYGGAAARAGSIIIRQRGTKWHPGDNVYMGKDFTIHAKVDGTVTYKKGRRNRTYVHILPFDEVVETVAQPPKVKPSKPSKPVVDETVEVKMATTVTAAEEAPAEAPAEESAIVEQATEVRSAEPAPAAVEEEKAEEPAPVEEEKAEEPAPVAAAPAAKAEKDNLKKHIEGIGPKIESLLNEAGILTFAQLAATDPEKIREILLAAGSRYKMHDPTTWPKQAEMADAGNWDELKKWQDELDGGRA